MSALQTSEQAGKGRADAGDVYEAIWPKLLASPAIGEAHAEIGRAKGLKRDLMALARHRRRVVAGANARFHCRALAELFLSSPATSPEERIDAATLALVIGQCLDVKEEVKHDIMARALALRANALRRMGKLVGAARDLHQAKKLIRDFPHLLEARALYLSSYGFLKRREGDDEEALALLARAAEIFADLGQAEVVAAHLLELGHLYLLFSESARALDSFGEALITSPIPATLGFEALRGLAIGLVFEGKRGDAGAILGNAACCLSSPWKERTQLLCVVLDEAGSERRREETLHALIARLFELGEKREAALGAILLRGETGTEVTADLLPFIPPKLRHLVVESVPFDAGSYHALLREFWGTDLPLGEHARREARREG